MGSIELLKEMFEEMVLKKNVKTIPKYYHPEFFLTSNQETMDYKTFLEFHEKAYATPIQYKVEYDEETLIEKGDRFAGRMWITISHPNEPEKRLEVILIGQYKEKKLYRLWELTFPNWSDLPPLKITP